MDSTSSLESARIYLPYVDSTISLGFDAGRIRSEIARAQKVVETICTVRKRTVLSIVCDSAHPALPGRLLLESAPGEAVAYALGVNRCILATLKAKQATDLRARIKAMIAYTRALQRVGSCLEFEPSTRLAQQRERLAKLHERGLVAVHETVFLQKLEQQEANRLALWKEKCVTRAEHLKRLNRMIVEPWTLWEQIWSLPRTQVK